MKKVLVLLLITLLLCGCSAKQTMETVDDVYASQSPEMPKQVALTLPEDAVLTMVNGDSRLYFCNGYELVLEVMTSGDLNETIANLTGFSRNGLTVMQTESDEIIRYECVWTAVSDQGDMIGRAVILDDGSYHYCLCVLSHADEAGSLQETWSAITASFQV